MLESFGSSFDDDEAELGIVADDSREVVVDGVLLDLVLVRGVGEVADPVKWKKMISGRARVRERGETNLKTSAPIPFAASASALACAFALRSSSVNLRSWFILMWPFSRATISRRTCASTLVGSLTASWVRTRIMLESLTVVQENERQ